MQWIEGLWQKRYKRFFVDVWVPSLEKTVTAHCPNTGPMRGLGYEGQRVWIRYVDDPKRRLAYTLEAMEDQGSFVGVNTHLPNTLIGKSWHNLPFSHKDDEVKREVKVEQSRLDFWASSSQRPSFYLEVKNVHLKRGKWSLFPDTTTQRGAKHLKTLIDLKHQGHDVALVYVVQREDCTYMDVARDLDPVYSTLWDQAREQGVQCWAFPCHVQPDRATITLKTTPLPLVKEGDIS